MIIGDLVDANHAEIRTGPFGTQLKAASYVPEGRPVLNVRNVGFGDVRDEKLEFADEATAERLSVHLLQPDDIVFGRKGAVERHAFITPRFAGSLQGSDCIRLRLGPNSPIRPKFVSYALRTKDHQQWMINFCSHGATMASLNQDILRQIVLPDIEIAAQDAAIDVLEPLEHLIENTRRRIEVLEQMAQAIYREWFVHLRYPGHEDVRLVDSDLGPMPESWTVPALQEIARVVRGRSYRKHELVDSGGLSFVNLKCMRRGGGFRRDGLKRYDGEYKPDQRVSEGDIVLAVTDLTQGREILARATLVPRLADDFGVISLDVVRIVPMQPKDRLPLLFALRESGFPDRVKEYANGSTVLHLSPNDVAEALVLWASADLRQRFSETVTPMISLIDDLADAADRLAELRDLLLPRLVSGQIDVSELDLDELVGQVT